MKLALNIAFQKNTVYAAIKISIIVGLILNFINQGDAIINAQIDRIDITKALLTFFVPYLVSTYSVAQTKLAFNVGGIAAVDVDLYCKHCESTTEKLARGNKIPICPNCNEYTNWKITE
jgi:hypothetical protein